MKILVIGDPHFKVERLHIVSKLISKILEITKKEKPDFVVCLGDILHKHGIIDLLCLNKVLDFLELMALICPIYMIVGNHDMLNNKQFLSDNHSLRVFKKFKNAIIVDRVIQHQGFVFVPYVYPGRFEEALNTLESFDWKDATCIFAHQELRGCIMEINKEGEIKSTNGDKWPRNYPLVISGHIHHKQRPQRNIIYPGSCMEHTFGDTLQGDKKTILLCEFGEDSVNFTEIDLKMRRKKTISMTISEFKECNISKYLQIQEDFDLRLKIKATPSEYMAISRLSKFTKMSLSGIKIVLDVVNDIKIEVVKTSDFRSLLEEEINKKKNKKLKEIYKEIIT